MIKKQTAIRSGLIKGSSDTVNKSKAAVTPGGDKGFDHQFHCDEPYKMAWERLR